MKSTFNPLALVWKFMSSLLFSIHLYGTSKEYLCKYQDIFSYPWWLFPLFSSLGCLNNQWSCKEKFHCGHCWRLKGYRWWGRYLPDHLTKAFIFLISSGKAVDFQTNIDRCHTIDTAQKSNSQERCELDFALSILLHFIHLRVKTKQNARNQIIRKCVIMSFRGSESSEMSTL